MATKKAKTEELFWQRIRVLGLEPAKDSATQILGEPLEEGDFFLLGSSPGINPQQEAFLTKDKGWMRHRSCSVLVATEFGGVRVKNKPPTKAGLPLEPVCNYCFQLVSPAEEWTQAPEDYCPSCKSPLSVERKRLLKRF